MHTTVIYAHPYEGSFNHAVLEAVVGALRAGGASHTIIDLYADGFNPVMSREELAVYSQGGWKDPLTQKYIEALDAAQRLIIIFPLWWYDFPAILKGFFDKVMLPGSAFTEDSSGMHPLRDIKRTVLCSTSSAPTKALVQDFGDAVNGVIIRATFRALGFNGALWHHLGCIDNATEDERQAYLREAARLVSA